MTWVQRSLINQSLKRIWDIKTLVAQVPQQLQSQRMRSLKCQFSLVDLNWTQVPLLKISRTPSRTMICLSSRWVLPPQNQEVTTKVKAEAEEALVATEAQLQIMMMTILKLSLIKREVDKGKRTLETVILRLARKHLSKKVEGEEFEVNEWIKSEFCLKFSN